LLARPARSYAVVAARRRRDVVRFVEARRRGRLLALRVDRVDRLALARLRAVVLRLFALLRVRLRAVPGLPTPSLTPPRRRRFAAAVFACFDNAA
jgi:hypothetical protein